LLCASALPYIEYVQTTGHKVSGIYSYIHTVGQTVLLSARDQDLYNGNNVLVDEAITA
jgi:hypothetical protein